MTASLPWPRFPPTPMVVLLLCAAPSGGCGGAEFSAGRAGADGGAGTDAGADTDATSARGDAAAEASLDGGGRDSGVVPGEAGTSCHNPDQCPPAAPCHVATCNAGVCGSATLPQGTTCSGNGGASVCSATGACVAAGCTDGVKDGNETDVDCGGSCSPCANSKDCKVPSDCESIFCKSGVCAACAFATQCPTGDYCDLAINGGTCRPGKTNGNMCATSAQCASGFCVGGVCCDTACSAACQACNVAPNVGVCSSVPSGSNVGCAIGDQCCAGSCTAVNTVGNCGSCGNACAMPTSSCQTVVCAVAGCMTLNQTAGTACNDHGGHLCDGQGNCK